MEIIDVVKLDENGVDVEDKNYGTPGETKYFDDNGGLPDGNFDEDNLEGSWILIDGEVDFDNIEYAYRSIDDTTLVKLDDLVEGLKGKTMIESAKWFEENDPEFLEGVMESEYCDFEKEDAIIEIQFDEGGSRVYASAEWANCEYPSQNQPEWFEDSWENWKDHPELIEKYYNKLCK